MKLCTLSILLSCLLMLNERLGFTATLTWYQTNLVRKELFNICFRSGHSLSLAFGSFFYPIPPPLNSSTVNQCDRCLVPLAWGLMAGGRRFASHGGVTLSRGWPCHRWKPLDIPGTHLHSATQLLMLNERLGFTATLTWYQTNLVHKELFNIFALFTRNWPTKLNVDFCQ